MKPLFEPSTTVKPLDLSSPATSSANLPSVNIEKAVAPQEKRQLRVITEGELEKISQAETGSTANVTRELISYIKTADAGEFGEKLTELVLLAKGLDPQSVQGKGIMAKIRNSFSSTKERMLTQYNLVEKGSLTLLAHLDKDAALHKKRIGDFDVMYVNNMNDYHKYKAAQETLGQRLAELRNDILAFGTPTDAFAGQELAEAERNANRAEKRIDDYGRLMLMTEQNAPQIRMYQDFARTLVEKFADVKAITFPAWQSVFSMELLANEQKSATRTLTAIDDTTNEALRRGADLTRQNAQNITKLSQRSVIDFETLQYRNTQFIGALEDMKKINDDGAAARKAALPQLMQMEKDLIAGFAPGQR